MAKDNRDKFDELEKKYIKKFGLMLPRPIGVNQQVIAEMAIEALKTGKHITSEQLQKKFKEIGYVNKKGIIY